MSLTTLVAEPVSLPAVERKNLPSEPARFNVLTGFRCLAACLVFVYHNRKYWRDSLPAEVIRLFNEFHIGVSLFFVLSGFLIAYTYGQKPLQSFGAYKRYIGLRLARILPLYWLILTCYYIDTPYSKGAFTPLTYSLTHAFSNVHNLDGLAQAWSLNVELCFYMLAPLLCLLQHKHLLYLIVFLAVLLAAAWAVGYTWHRVNGNRGQFFYPANFLLHSTFFGRSTEFTAGLVLAGAWKSGRIRFLQQLRHKTLTGLAGIFIITYIIGLFQKNSYQHGTDTVPGLLILLFILPVFTVITFAGLMEESTWIQRFFASRVMVFLGNASFAFYLVHISYVNLKIKSWVLLPDRNFVLLWIVSMVLYITVEKPIYQLCRRWLKPKTIIHSALHAH